MSRHSTLRSVLAKFFLCNISPPIMPAEFRMEQVKYDVLSSRLRHTSPCPTHILFVTRNLPSGPRFPKAAAIPVARRHLHDHSFKVISRVFRVMFLQNRDDLANVNDPLLQEHMDIGFGEVTHGETTFKDAGQLTQFVILPRTTGRQTEANRS